MCVARRIKFVLRVQDKYRVIIPLINVGPETYKTATFCDVLCYWAKVVLPLDAKSLKPTRLARTRTLTPSVLREAAELFQ